jgi:hypothetical protein
MMRDFLKRKFLSILNLFFWSVVWEKSSRERDEQHRDYTRQPAAAAFPVWEDHRRLKRPRE